MTTTIEIDKDIPFKNCKLDREKYANILCDVVESNKNGFVIAINNEWGTGKTTFLKMWQQLLENNNFQTIYFNAWENDFEQNPLTALIGELHSLIKQNKDKYDTLIKNGVTLSKHILPLIVKSVIEKHIETKIITEGLEKLTEGITSIFEKEIDEYSERKKNINDFRLSLSKFVADSSNGKPLVFIIDELDRCRPNYAVSILEQIKHFFIVPNIVFAISIDREQLEHAIKGVYGSESINAEEYLRRFIDIEYTIPRPESSLFINYLFGFYNFEDNFNNYQKKDDFKRCLSFVIESSKLTLRQQEKLFTHVATVLKISKNFSTEFVILLVILIYLRLMHKKLYEDIRYKRISIENVQTHLSNIFTSGINNHILARIEAHLVFYYHNYIMQYIPIYEEVEDKLKLRYSSIFKDNSNLFEQALQGLNSNHDHNDFQIIYLMNKIDLIG